MRAVTINAPGKIAVSTVRDPTPSARQVVVEVEAVGICGTDLHILDGEFQLTSYPIIPGHEFAGTVVAVGSEVTALAAGDRVAVDPSLCCGDCRFCAAGRGNLCERWNAIGITTPGACAQYTAVPAVNCHLLPEQVSLEHAALVEPLSCALYGFDLLPGRIGENYLIYGAGTMGLMMAQLARRAGAASVSVVDPNSDRLAVADKLGVDLVATRAGGLNRPEGWEVVIDCTGAVAAIEDGLRSVRRGGTFLMSGVAAPDATASFSPYRIHHDEITIFGRMAVLHSFARAIELMATGAIEPAAMISHDFPLDQYPSALDMFRAGRGRKVHIRPSASARQLDG